jgi:hypothetical protein
MRLVFLACAVLATTAVAPPAAAQASPIVGTWELEYERGRSIENGVATPIMGKGTMTIAAQGDSLVATLQSGPRPDGSVPPLATFGGRLTGQRAVLVHQTTMTVNLNGESRTAEVSLTWSLEASGNAISGTLVREASGFPGAAEPTPVKGTRAS